MFGRKPLTVNNVTKYVIVDGGHYPTDKEYIDLGVREGWLILYRILHTKPGETEYQYSYPASYQSE